MCVIYIKYHYVNLYNTRYKYINISFLHFLHQKICGISVYRCVCCTTVCLTCQPFQRLSPQKIFSFSPQTAKAAHCIRRSWYKEKREEDGSMSKQKQGNRNYKVKRRWRQYDTDCKSDPPQCHSMEGEPWTPPSPGAVSRVNMADRLRLLLASALQSCLCEVCAAISTVSLPSFCILLLTEEATMALQWSYGPC